MAKAKLIFAFMRINNDFEKIAWYKLPSGEKFSIRFKCVPTHDQLERLHADKHKELLLCQA